MLFEWLNRPVDLFGSPGNLAGCQIREEQMQPTHSTTSSNQGSEPNTRATKVNNRLTDRPTDRSKEPAESNHRMRQPTKLARLTHS
jgi:hypothetical protein